MNKKDNKINNKKFLKITIAVILGIIILFVVLDSVNNKYKFIKPEYEINEKIGRAHV